MREPIESRRDLRSLGAGPEKLVALCLERSADLVAGMLGIAKSGAAYIPLDPAYPKGRIANIFEDAKPLVVLTSTTFAACTAGSSRARVICLDALGDVEQSSDACTLELSPATSQENLAYVIFTSGSTGRPKGVQITHRSLVNFLEAMRKEPGFSPQDVLLAVTTPSFDIAASGAAAAALHRRDRVHRAPARRSGGAACGSRALPAHGDAGHTGDMEAADCGRVERRSAAENSLRRRSPGYRSGAVSAGSFGESVEHVRADRDHHLVRGPARRRGGKVRHSGGPSHPEHVVLRPR